MCRTLFLSLATVQLLGVASAWAPVTPLALQQRQALRPSSWSRPRLAAGGADDDEVERTSFDQAGASLIEEEDQKRMEQMGDFDTNDSVRHVLCL